MSSRVALVTGAGNGLGAAIATALAEQGTSVLVADIDFEAAERTAAALAERGLAARAAEHDVTDPEAWERVVGEAVDAFGSLDVLVNNAAIFSWATIDDEDLETWRQMLEVNLTGPFLGIKIAAPALVKGESPSIVNISSIWALSASPSDAAYHASKGGLLGLSRNAAATYADRGIRVNAICPGVIATAATAETTENDPVERTRARTALGRDAEPAEIAAVVAFLASAESSYVTGAVWTADGGYTV
jgi:3alpha(or 20beta)-hydroxysteroid dehydrogenase